MRPPLADLDLLAGVARHRSFRRAAQEAGLSPSSLSERIRALEDALGVRLLHRTTRSVGPTEAGAALLARLGPALREIGEALAEAGGAQGGAGGTLRINAPQSAAQLVLAPLLPRFLAAHPRVTVEVVVEDGFIDIVEGGFDAGIRYGESLARDTVAVPLGGPQRYVLVAAPALLARCGTPAAPRDLLGLPCIRHRFPGGNLPPWVFERGAESVAIRPEGPLVTTDPHVERAAALAGAGFLMTFEEWVSEDIASGRLVPLLREWLPPFEGPFLYYASRRHLPAPLRTFVAFLRALPRDAAE
ncbi:LysR family transcriptional regulator [Teichococcus aestuarii]|uniref:LysR family transcriptional regulator n=1 Tax=Teichococcus aestuarii TaxID=568898 RepID=UPI00361B8AA3